MLRSRIVLLIFSISGAAGLIYEVVWARDLVLVFGNTSQAISAILTAFFGGMAIGSVIGGRIADRVHDTLRLYGLLEIALAGVAVATPSLLTGVRDLYGTAFATLQGAPSQLALARLGLSLVALGPATVLMGATLPTLTRHLTSSRLDVRREFARLYSANTFGALAGTTLSGFVLIELFGLTVTLLVGAAGSVTAGLAALFLAARRRAPVGGEQLVVAPAARVARDATAPKAVILGVALVSGLTSLGYQVLWTRLISSGTSVSSYVFTIILMLFLSGIAVGAVAHVMGVGRQANPVLVLAISQVLVAGLALASLTLVGSATAPAIARIGVILPATLVMGFALPLAAGLTTSGNRTVGSDTGLLLGANTAGTVMGSFAVPFWLIPAVGSPHAVVLLAALNAATAAALLRYAGGGVRARRTRGRRIVGGMAYAVLGVALLAPMVDPGYIADRVAVRVESHGKLFAAREDEIASTVAGKINGQFGLWVNGISMTGLTVDTHLIALLPLMARPASQTALVIAFGMGTTYRSALRAGLEVRSAELVPSVPSMFGYYYRDGPAVLQNPRGTVTITDGRNEVELTSQRFDIIVADPPPPITTAGTGVLYSIEFYRACASDLTEGGIMLQWMPYAQSIDEFRAHMRTFDAVFPNVAYLLSPGGNGVFMLGSAGELNIGDAGIRQALARPGVLADLEGAPDSPHLTVDEWVSEVKGLAWAEGAPARSFAGAGDIISDDRPRTEYFLLRSIFGPRSPAMTPDSLKVALSGNPSSP